MDFTEKTVTDFFRKVGQQSAGYRLVDHLRAENLMLVPAAEVEFSETYREVQENGKKAAK